MFPSALSFKYLIYREHFFPYQEFNISILSFAWNHLTSTALYAHTYCVLAFYSLEVTFSLWLHWTYHIPISLGVLLLQTRQVPLQLSYLRLKPDLLTIELSVMTLRNVQNGGLTMPEVCFLHLFQRGEKWPPSTTKASLQLSPTWTCWFHPLSEPAFLFHPFSSWRTYLARTLLEDAPWSWMSHVANRQPKWLGNWRQSRNSGLWEAWSCSFQ